jgi:diketogulonate reductase-like aldo/keto reductase
MTPADTPPPADSLSGPDGPTPAGTLRLPSGRAMPRLGLGTWHMGERPAQRANEVAAIRAALDQGLILVDTAEMYGDGGAEAVVGEATAGRRDRAFLVSKVLPFHADRAGTVAACEASLRRLATDRLDLFLLHWPGAVPLEETLEAFDRLQAAGKILDFGVSNFDRAEMDRAVALAPGRLAANQIYYNLAERAADSGLIEACGAAGVAVMAYSPLDEGRLAAHAGLAGLARDLGVTPATLAVAWTLRLDPLVSIPKTARAARVGELAAAASLVLDEATLQALDKMFPPPSGPRRLSIV